ncbi:MAG TPA: signal peptidase II [Planctomycetota bacterium]|nr:signal peptidase II [Planctomycetota bacterium]
MTRRAAVFLATALAGACVDLGTKSLVFAHFSRGATAVILPHVLTFQLTTNPGIAWGLFPSRAWGLVSLVALPIIALAFLKRKEARRTELFCGSLILAGAAGNAWDRVVLCSVRDFILLPWWPWMPNFNLADAMLSVSVCVLLLLWIRYDRRPVRQSRPAPAPQPDDGGFGDVGRDHGPRP